MNYVEPIRDLDKVLDIACYLRKRSERNYIMFLYGIYTGRRISDILKIRVKDVRNKDKIMIREKKTNKYILLPIHRDFKEDLQNFVKDLDDYDYVFKSTQKNKPISRVTAYCILKEAAQEYGLKSIGTHTLRKTFGYHFYQQTKDIGTLMMIFNHTSEEYTLRYIGINKENIESAFKNFKLLKPKGKHN